MPLKSSSVFVLSVIVSSLCFIAGISADTPSSNTAPPDATAVSDAICPIVYPVDETPSEQGYQYIFYGNGFFINKDGYLLTAAHVLSAFRNGGGQPYILVGRPEAPRVLQKADLIAVDWKHDVAVLRATPNPFQGKYQVAYLPLTAKSIASGDSVQAVALRPSKVQDAHTYDAPLHDRFIARVLDFEFTQEEKGAPDTELLLFNHEVLRGQSGSPLTSADTHEVVGIVDGRWLRPSAGQVAKTASAAAPTEKVNASAIGAAVRIHYAIALLQQQGIKWEPVSQAPATSTASPPRNEADQNPSVPFPVSLVAAPYPVNALFGGEVVLDTLVSKDGKLSDVQVVHGDPPFRSKAEDAVQTWSFRPARIDERTVDTRIAVVYDFAQPFLPSPVPRGREYPPPPDSDDRAPLPVYTVQPSYPPETVSEGTVFVLGRVDAQGQLISTQVIRGADPLASAMVAAMHQWRFVSGKRDGEPIESEVIAVATFIRPALTQLHSPKSVNVACWLTTTAEAKAREVCIRLRRSDTEESTGTMVR